MAARSPGLRIFWVLLVVAMILVVIGVVDRGSGGGAFLREAFSNTGSWISKPFVAVGQWFSQTWSGLANLGSMSAELERLRVQNAELQSRLTLLEEAKQENESLRGFLQVKATVTASQTLVASVLMNEPSAYTRSILINVGTRDGITKRMPVLASSGGLLGQIIEVYQTKARVLLITDLNASVSGKIQSTGELAVVRGDGREACTLERLAKETSMKAGDQVVTSGEGGIFPPGLLIGTISQVEVGSALYMRAQVIPVADLSAIKFVMVLKVTE